MKRLPCPVGKPDEGAVSLLGLPLVGANAFALQLVNALIAARQFWDHGVDKSSWCPFVRSFRLAGARVPQLQSSIAELRRMDVARRPDSHRVATHAYPGEQTPLCLSAKAILTRHQSLWTLSSQ